MLQLEMYFMELLLIIALTFVKTSLSGGGTEYYKSSKKSLKKIKTSFAKFVFINNNVKPL